MTYIKTRAKSGKSGSYKIVSFLVKPNKTGEPQIGDIPSGRYYKLTYKSKPIRTNTPKECSHLMTFVCMARGLVLINGLKLGLMVEALLAKKEVTGIVVIEKSKDVLNLVAPEFKKEKRVKFVNADPFKHKSPKGEVYHCVWNDVWDHNIPDNLREIEKLHKKYKKKARYIEAWCQHSCELMNERLQDSL